MKKILRKTLKILGIAFGLLVLLLVVMFFNRSIGRYVVDGIRLERCDSAYIPVLRENGYGDSIVGISVHFHRAIHREAAIPFLPGMQTVFDYRPMSIESFNLFAEDSTGKLIRLGPQDFLPLLDCPSANTFLRYQFLRSAVGFPEKAMLTDLIENSCNGMMPMDSLYGRLARTAAFDSLPAKDSAAFAELITLPILKESKQMNFFGSMPYFEYCYRHGIVDDWYKGQLKAVTFLVKPPHSKSKRFHAQLKLESGAVFTATKTMQGWGQ